MRKSIFATLRFSAGLCSLAFAAFLALPAGAGELLDSLGDPRVRECLDEEGLHYRVNERGQYLLTFDMDDDRTHLVVVNSNTSDLDGFEIREVFCVAYKGAPLSKVQMSELLCQNSNFVLGAWEISDIETDEDNKRSQMVRFSARIPADCPAELLNSVVVAVCRVGDRLEADWLGTDEW